MSSTIDELVKLASQHKLVPFLGAGCSMSILHKDWDTISNEMAQELGVQSEDNTLVAQMYVDRFGRDGLCEFLKQRLLIDSFDAERGTTYLKIMSLGLGIIYTTNQDNVLEKCLEQFGRSYKVITTIDDLVESYPRDRLLFKYHGDLSVPDSVVFTADDYKNRIENPDHFLNIRLRADLLAKNLLFVGYGLRDKNIQGLLSGLQTAFHGKLPKAYLIAYRSNDDFEKFCAGFGVTVIDPMKEFPNSKNIQEAFDSLLSTMAENTIRQKHEDEFTDLFTPKVPPSRKVLIIGEANAVEQAAVEESFSEAIHTFRNNLDTAIIPEAFENKVLNSFITLTQKCSTENEASQLHGAAFNLYLNHLESRLMVQACVMTTANLRDPKRGIDSFLPHTRNFQDELNVLAGAKAIELLMSWGRTINDTFRINFTNWMELRSASIDSFPPEIQAWITERINMAWTRTTLENPIARQRRLGQFLNRGNKNISGEFFNMIPRGFFTPYH